MTLSRFLTTGLFSLSLGLLAVDASAATNPCGNIELTAIGSCELRTSGGCQADCTPLSFVAACDGQCNASASATCQGSCQASCEAECNVKPAAFSCQGQCTTDCRARIAVQCEGEADQAGCRSYCDAMCDTDCQAQCNVVAPEADCKAKCQGSCGGSCETQANFDCTYDCSAELKGGCDVSCEAPQGALFCDGQFINVTNVEECLAYVASNLQIEGSAEASGTVSCAAAPGPSTPVGGLLAGLGAVVASLAARRARRAR
ncbi:MAG: hypothetical protein EOO74_00450 [Myxococcales bacterium]|nr:MAG: hypothetical protein EOO74_00450 [Myxococcales bacterium]